MLEHCAKILGVTMKFSVFLILILCVFGLYGVKHLCELYENGTLKEKVEKAARKALRFTLRGIAFVGLAWLALYMFPVVRRIGFSVFSASAVESIRLLMEVVLDTRSVYAAIQIFASATLFVVELSLVFSIFGFFVTKTPVIPHILEYSRLEKAPEEERCTEVAIPRTFRKIFLNFANLRI